MGLAVLAGSCKQQHQPVGDMVVDIAEVEGGMGSLRAEYPGQTEAENATDLSFKVMGTIQRVLVKEGDHVRRGQTVAILDDRDYRTQLAATESEYRQIAAECDRVIAMHKERAVSDNDFDKARSGLERITAQLTYHRNQVNDCVLRAPYDGYVESVYRTDKETASPGLPIISMFTAGNTEVVINIPETEYMQRGQSATYEAKFSAFPGQTFPLTLKGVTSKANANQLYQMRLGLKENKKDITPGMSVMVTIQRSGSDNDSRAFVPTGAVAGEGSQSYVYVFDEKTGTVKKTDVEVENLRADGTAVIKKGLKAGMKVVASGVSKLTDGQHVKPLDKASELNVGNLL